MKEDILNFEVWLYSPDGVNSPVIEHLIEVYQKDDMAFKNVLLKLLIYPS